MRSTSTGEAQRPGSRSAPAGWTATAPTPSTTATATQTTIYGRWRTQQHCQACNTDELFWVLHPKKNNVMWCYSRLFIFVWFPWISQQVYFVLKNDTTFKSWILEFLSVIQPTNHFKRTALHDEASIWINLSGKGRCEGHSNFSTMCLLYFKMERISFQLRTADKNISFLPERM